MGACLGRLCCWSRSATTRTSNAPKQDNGNDLAKSHEVDNSRELPNTTSLLHVDFIPLTMSQSSPDIPPRPAFTPFSAPYLCSSAPYDRGGFWTYPARRGWVVHVKDTMCHVLCPPGTCHHGMNILEMADDVSRKVRPAMLSRTDGAPVIASDKAAFLQAWLLFGVLDEVSKLCGLALDAESEFVIGGASVSTAGLNGMPRRWFEAAAATHHGGNKPLMERILAVARQAYLVLGEEIHSNGQHLTPRFEYTYPECRVLQSLDILVRTVGLHLLSHTYIHGFTATEEEGWGQDRILKSLNPDGRDTEGMDRLSDLARDELEEKGWCESELDLMTPEDLAFASLLERPRIRDHSGCGDVICGAYQTDETTYRTQHVEDGCGCDFVGVETSVLVEALARDRVPKVLITEELGLQAAMTDDDYPYIALSHVWADGLGNPKENALPRCQLRRLRAFADHLYRTHHPTAASTSLPVGLWMDTLCIPVAPSARASRKKAIQLLGKTFNNANAVLVLDRELEIIDPTTTFLELGLRILCSGWVKRLWTLQEATLASEALGVDKLYFQMRDGVFLYQKYDRDRRAPRAHDGRTTELQAEERHLLLDVGVMLLLGAQIPSVRAMRDMRERWSPFRVIYSAIEHRSTSKVEDVPVCVASLLGKDLTSILSAASAEHRMAAFYMLMRQVPSGVLWAERAAKLSIKPFRWAPSSVTACGETAYMGWPDAVCDSSGLHVKYPGFVFDLAADETLLHDGVSPRLPSVSNLIKRDTGDVFAQLRWSSRRSPVIPLRTNMAVIYRPSDERGGVDPNPNAVVVIIASTVECDSDGMNPTEFICEVVGHLDLLPPGGDHDIVFHGHETATDQRWCVT